MEQYSSTTPSANASVNTEYENSFVSFFAKSFLKDDDKAAADDQEVMECTGYEGGEGENEETQKDGVDDDDEEEDIVRFFDRGDYFTLHGNDAVVAAMRLFKTQTVVKYWNPNSKWIEGGLPTVSLSKLQAEGYMRSCLSSGKIQVWTSTGTKSSASWSISKSGSPGNWTAFEDIMESSNGASNALSGLEPKVIAVQIKVDPNQKNSINLVIAIADASSRTLGYAELVDNDLFTQFESALIQWGVKECLLSLDPGTSSLSSQLLNVIRKRSGIIATTVKKRDFSLSTSCESDLQRLVKESSKGQVKLVSTNPFAKLFFGCFSCLFQYLQLLSDDSQMGQFVLEKLYLKDYMKLDTASIRALHLLPSVHEAKSMSLFGLLNKCQTGQGSRLLNQFIRQPLVEKDEIEKRLNFIELLISDSELDLALRDILKNMPDLIRMCKKLLKGNANIQDLLTLFDVSLQIPKFKSILSEYEGIHSDLVKENWLQPLVEELFEPMARYSEMISATVDLERANRHEYLLKADFNPELADMRKEMDDLEAKIGPELLRVSRVLDLEVHKKVKYEKSPIYGRHFRVTRTDSSALSGKGFIELSTQKSGTIFVSQLMKQISESLSSLEKEYTSKQNKMVKEIVAIAATYAPTFSSINHWIAQIDVLSLACGTGSYTRPKILPMGSGKIEMKGSRHPCVEALDSVSFIANDVSMVKGTSDFQIITGPNMGGKSTYIRQVALVTLMAQIGCYVPCQEATLCIVDSILARVGASDAQQKGISTFMAEMLETACILKRATSNSFIIIDELGRGTSTTDGFGLAWAISEHIVKKLGSFCLFATHFHELSVLADENQNVQNLHVSALATGKSMTLLYKVRDGVCDQSFGIHVAEMAKFPKFVVDLARQKSEQMEEHQKRNDMQVEEEYDDNNDACKRKRTRIASDFLARLPQVLTRDQVKTMKIDEILGELNVRLFSPMQ